MIKRMMPWMIMMLTSITLITLAAFILWHLLTDDNNADSVALTNGSAVEQYSAKDLQNLSVHIDGYTTNLSDMNYLVRLSFSFILENKKTKEEMELLIPTVKAIINRTLADTAPDEMMGSEGLDRLDAILKDLINPILKNGKLLEIEITERLITVQH